MTFADLLDLSRLYVPGAKSKQVPDELLKKIINKGAEDVARLTKCMQGDKKFAIESGQYEYSIHEFASDYLMPTKAGVKIYNGTDFVQIEPKTENYFDQEFQDWRNSSSGTGLPEFYYIDENKIGFYKTPITSYDEGAQLFYYRKPEIMVDDGDIPFHVFGDKKTEIPSLTALDDSILDYVKWKVAEPLSKNDGEIRSRMQDYYGAAQERIKTLKKREDLNSDNYNKRRQKPCGLKSY